MTEEQSKCLAFIDRFIREHGFSPSYDEIAAGLGLSPKSKGVVHNYVVCLEREGKIKRIPSVARSIDIVRAPHTPRELAEILTKELEQAHGFDDGEGVVIACTVAECLRTLKAALA